MKTDFEGWVETFKTRSKVSLDTNMTSIAFEAWKAGYDLAVQQGIAFTGVEKLCEIRDLTLPSWSGGIEGLVLVGYGSWGGSYDEPCLYIQEDPNGCITPHDLSTAREALLSETFYGYKGGEYKYYEYYRLNVETSCSSWSDGRYIQQLFMKYPDFRMLFKD